MSSASVIQVVRKKTVRCVVLARGAFGVWSTIVLLSRHHSVEPGMGRIAHVSQDTRQLRPMGETAQLAI